MANISIGGRLSLLQRVASLDLRYGPYSSIADAYDNMGPSGDEVITAGLPFGVTEDDGSVSVYIWTKGEDATQTDCRKLDKEHIVLFNGFIDISVPIKQQSYNDVATKDNIVFLSDRKQFAYRDGLNFYINWKNRYVWSNENLIPYDDVIYIDINDNKAYYYNGTTLTLLASETFVSSINNQAPDSEGNVNLTKEHIGLEKVDNTSDAEKVVKGASEDGSGNNIATTYETKIDATTKQTALQGAINALQTSVAALTGLDSTNFGGFSIQTTEADAISNISTIYTADGYTNELLWYMAGTSLSSVKAYRYNGSGTPTLISNDSYNCVDFSGLITDVAALSSNLTALGPKISGVAGGDVEPDVTWENGLIYSNGNVSTSIAYQKSNKIAVKKGETLTFTGGNLSALAARAVAAYVDDTFSAADSRYYANNTSAESISYTATKDVDVIVSSEKTLFQGPIKITIPSKIAELDTTLKTSVSRINKLDDTSFGILGSHNITDGVLNSNNTFGTGGTSALISVNGGDSYKIVGHRLHNVIYAFLKSYPSLWSAVVYATGASRQVISTADTYTATGTIPSDAAYLLVSMTVGNVDWSPSKIVFNDEEFPASSQSIKDTLVELNSKITSSANELTNTFDKKISYSPTDVVENAGYFLQSAVGLYPTKAASSDSLNVVTDPISLNEGEILHFVGATIHSQPFVGALCLEDGTLRESIIENKGDGSYSYCATKDCYVVLSYDTRTTHYVWKTPVIPSGVSCRDIYMRYNVNTDNTYYDISSKTFKDGNQIWCSMTIEAEGVLFVDFSTYLPSGVTSPVALLVFLGDDDEYIKFAFDFRNLSVTGNYSNRVYAPIGTKKIVVCQRTGYAKDTTLHLYEGRKIPFTQEQSFSTMREMVSSGARGLVSVGQMLFKSKISSPTQKFHTQTGISNGSYFDANKSFAQYSTVGESHHIPDSILDGAVGEEISFVPEAGYLRKIVGKGEDDTFYIEFYPSSYGSSPAGTANRVLLEKTTDFVNFTTIAKGYNSTSDDGVFIPDIMLLGILIVKECADGSLIVGCKYRDASMSATDGSGNTRNNEFLGCLRISPDRSSMSICTGIDIDGNSSRVIGSHGLADGGTAYVSAGMYDWHLQVCGNRVLMSEYGSRDSLHDDWGRVWYSDDCGVHWKEVWQTRNHISEGVADGSQQPSHTHGIMIDPYSDTIWVIVGETNRNLYYTDKGMEATDNDWTCIPIRDQLILPSISYMQVVNGYPFKDRIVFGSDNSGIGALYAINRLEDGGFSDIEIAHEVLPFNFAGTTYCAGAQSRRDLNSPALLCVTRENHANTEEQNELLMQQHLGRVIATWDGINFFEIWHDNSYGEHTVKVNGDLTTRNIAYCTRDMQAWLLKNGDLVIKYAGRDYAYLGDTGYVAGYGDFCARCYIIRNAERYFAVK